MACNKRQPHHPARKDNQKTKLLHTSTKPVLNLTNLCDDVLLKICHYLNFEDLIALKKSSHLFISICCRALSGIIKGFDIDKMKIPLGSSKTDFQRSGELLRHFGKVLSSVKLDYACLDIAKAKQIHKLFVESCHESVTEIQFTGFRGELDFCKSFPNLKTLIIHSGCVHNLVWQIGAWFPSVEYLFICSYTNIADTLNARGHIPSLRNVCIHTYPVQDMNLFIACNPQLKMFYLNSCEYLESCRYNAWAMKAVETFSNAVELCLAFELRDFASVKQLMIPDGRVTQLILKEFDLRPITNFDFVTNYSNLKAFKFIKAIRPYRMINVHDLFDEAIQPILAQCKKLLSFKVIYQRCDSTLGYNHWVNEIILKSIELFKIIEPHVRLNVWKFSKEFSSNEVSFLLKKQD